MQPSVHDIQPIFNGVQESLLATPSLLSVFVPLSRDENPQSSNSAPASELDISRISSYIQHIFPNPSVSGMGKWCYDCNTPMKDPTTMEIHGRTVAALSEPQTDDNRALLRFIVVVQILHQLGHAICHHFNDLTTVIKLLPTFPVYVSNNFTKPYSHMEHGFWIEEALFGGIVGVMFDEHLDWLPPAFLSSDFTHISFLFLWCRDGRTYKLDVKERLESFRFIPFDVSKLEVVPIQHINSRTCAMLLGDHFFMSNPGPGADKTAKDELFERSYVSPLPITRHFGVRDCK
ncbi:unnamed protein product [Somion occarium]|uniref:Uncharacterized protein n=1 Tax=Somion occarium TaxID=3059160 RepID=A0ABP1DRL3_9APHY